MVVPIQNHIDALGNDLPPQRIHLSVTAVLTGAPPGMVKIDQLA
jgi:hypothetical protein